MRQLLRGEKGVDVNVALWIAAGLLAVLFLFAGLTKATTPKDKLVEKMPWVEDFSPAAVKLIGVLEVAGAVGLIVPALIDTIDFLVPLAAGGLAITMVLAVATHIRRKEFSVIPANLVLLALSAFVAWGRFGPYSF